MSPTQCEQVLIAAYRLWQKLPGPFLFADLVAQSWALYPENFGLWPHEGKYPCSNSVNSCVVGKRGLVARNHLATVQPRTYQITQAGLDRATELLGELRIVQDVSAAPALPVDLYSHYLSSPLLKMPMSTITHLDYFRFLGISSQTSNAEKIAVIERVHRELRAAAEVETLHYGLSDANQYRLLLNTSLFCMHRFRRHLPVPVEA